MKGPSKWNTPRKLGKGNGARGKHHNFGKPAN